MAQVTEKITYTATPEQVERMHTAFDEALVEARTMLGRTYPMIINGKERTAAQTFAATSPINRSLVLGNFQLGTRQDVDDAVAAAEAAYPAWSSRPYLERVEIMHRAAALVSERKFLLSALMILESGKNRAEAIGEIEEGADLIDEYASQLEAADGFVRPLGSLDPREHNVSILRPFGVWAVLAPFNFPNALSAGMSSGAMVAGNTVVFKPASATPLAGYELARCYIDAGIPDGVFNFITGSGSEVGAYLTMHKDVDGVIFTGSKEVGFDLFKQFSTEFPKPCITEMGGKNPTIVTANADLDKAVDGVARSAFGFSGQKCSACSRVYVERPVYDAFMEKLVARTKQLKVGNPAERDVYVGPVIDSSAQDRFDKAVASAKGGTIRAGGHRLTEGEYGKGTFVEPTVVDGLPLDHALFRDELFLPFVVVGPVDSLDEAVVRSNESEYGLTAGIFSEDQTEIDRFFNTIESGVIYANRRGGATTGAWPGCQSFCGWKGSGSTGKGGLGPYFVQQFLREQSRTTVIE
ncbi:MAG TPA: aldehyde dehydrogenase family protein [Thermomicrobiales bacterium]|nr:aldehyde dehydrogenase family protein [Thermomicrobiales bacterium]